VFGLARRGQSAQYTSREEEAWRERRAQGTVTAKVPVRLFDQGALSATTMTACWCAVLFSALVGTPRRREDQ